MARTSVPSSGRDRLTAGIFVPVDLSEPLARLEAKIAFTTLLERSPNLRLQISPDKLQYQEMPILHRLKELPVGL